MAAGDPEAGLAGQPAPQFVAANLLMLEDGRQVLEAPGTEYCFRIIRTLGNALMGKVKLACKCRRVGAEFEDMGELVAVKMLLKRCIRGRVTRDGRPVQEDPMQEFRVMTYLSNPGHINILRLQVLLEDAHLVFAVLDYAAEGDLYEVVASHPNRRLPEAQARQYFLELLQGCCYMHGMGIVHRDLSLENAMIGADGSIRIIDFGLMADRYEHGDGLVPAGGRVGKAGYMPPEVYHNRPFSEAVDMWCISVMLFIMLFGVPPYRKPHARLCRLFSELEAGRLRQLLTRWKMDQHVSPECLEFVTFTLQTDPAARPSIPELLRHPWMAPAVAALGPPADVADHAQRVLDESRAVLVAAREARRAGVAGGTAAGTLGQAARAAAPVAGQVAGAVGPGVPAAGVAGVAAPAPRAGEAGAVAPGPVRAVVAGRIGDDEEYDSDEEM